MLIYFIVGCVIAYLHKLQNQINLLPNATNGEIFGHFFGFLLTALIWPFVGIKMFVKHLGAK